MHTPYIYSDDKIVSKYDHVCYKLVMSGLYMCMNEDHSVHWGYDSNGFYFNLFVAMKDATTASSVEVYICFIIHSLAEVLSTCMSFT